jgi:hypothetical protein
MTKLGDSLRSEEPENQSLNAATFTQKHPGYAPRMWVSGSVRSLPVWHADGSWMEPFVPGPHRCVSPVEPATDADGRGPCGRNWTQAQEVPVDDRRDQDTDLEILQRPVKGVLRSRRCGAGCR